MFNKLSRLRNKGSSQNKKENTYPRAGTSAYSFDNHSVFSQSSGYSQKTAPPSEGFASYVDTYSVGQASSSDQWASSKGSSSLPEEGLDIGHPALLAYEDAEEQFLEDFEDYFEHLHVDNIRKEQYPKLDLQRIVYLDYANFALFSRFQVEEHMRVLLEEGPNLGSVSLSNASSSHLMSYILDTQQHLLQLFNINKREYSIIFTTGFTAGYRHFSEMYPFRKGSVLLTLLDNHESVKHIVSSIGQQGGKCIMAPLKEPDLSVSSTELRRLLRRQGWHGEGGGLFVYPAQSCLSGVRHSLNWIPEAQQNGWQVFLDVSTHLPVGSLDMSMHQPEFVLGSLHHMLGYPSGMGFLLVRKEAFSVQRDLQSLKLVTTRDEGSDLHIISEDDNINLLSFAALSFGLRHLESVGLLPIQKRVLSLATWLVQTLKSLRHKDEGKPLLQVYGPQSAKGRGSIVAFNVIDSTGSYFPASLVQKLADRNNIVVGAGHFSNPGLVTILNGGSDKALDSTIYMRPMAFSSLRVSLGPMSTFRDVYRLVQFLSRFRDEEYVSSEAMEFIEEKSF